ncbi:hypothetical protein J6590_030089 [Homalodisca vitripennis]|nr:hypothetical protein J6590_030089 [Homalodisca vitripennis]
MSSKEHTLTPLPLTLHYQDVSYLHGCVWESLSVSAVSRRLYLYCGKLPVEEEKEGEGAEQSDSPGEVVTPGQMGV